MVFSGYSGFLHYKTDRSDITEILLKMALNTITLNTLNPESRTHLVVSKQGENTSCVSRLEYIPHLKDDIGVKHHMGFIQLKTILPYM